MDKGEGGEMKSQDYIGRYLPDKHYRREPEESKKEPEGIFSEDEEYERKRDEEE